MLSINIFDLGVTQVWSVIQETKLLEYKLSRNSTVPLSCSIVQKIDIKIPNK